MMMGKTKFNIFSIFWIFLIILCKNHYRHDVVIHYISPSEFETLFNIYKMSEISVVQINRIMAKHEIQKNLKNSVLREKNYVKEKNKRTKNIEDNAPTYEKIKNETLNELDAYMRSYYSRYAKRKGLGKLDCSCEKKIFDIIDKSRKSNNKNLKKKIHLKYGFGFVTTCLLPLLGIILPLLDMIYSSTKHILPCPTTGSCTGSDQWKGGYKSILSVSGIPVEVSYIYIAFFLTLSYIILALIIYIMVKIVKYEKLKAEKGKMYFKEYCDFCKEVISK
ncbi:variable surface protein [Plasmodium gonderi]|uniref:Variable surface protein n=1 Tax=Plasmodium gonderi TaxID=77519 RepID=A0A1Y1JPL9_PLAGO|nr:variable surface protein [Plasmodium gonderi]GAW84566.1 variable surface protein [Plasmodium gonderi]